MSVTSLAAAVAGKSESGKRRGIRKELEINGKASKKKKTFFHPRDHSLFTSIGRIVYSDDARHDGSRLCSPILALE